MDHGLYFFAGAAAYAELGDRVTAWHKQGSVVRPEEFSGLSGREKVERVLELARLDWDVEPFDVFDEAHHLVRGWMAYRNTCNNYLMGVFRERYTILQNRELLRLTAPLLDARVLEFETAGSLRNGEDVWGLFRIIDGTPVGRDGVIATASPRFLLLANNHANRRVATIALTPIRVVCASTLSNALSKLPDRGKRAGSYPDAVMLRHTRDIVERAALAIEALCRPPYKSVD